VGIFLFGKISFLKPINKPVICKTKIAIHISKKMRVFLFSDGFQSFPPSRFKPSRNLLQIKKFVFS